MGILHYVILIETNPNMNSLRPIDTYNGLAVAYSVPNQYLNQCWFIVNCTHTNRYPWNFNQDKGLSFNKILSKIASATWMPLYSGLNVLMSIALFFLYFHPTYILNFISNPVCARRPYLWHFLFLSSAWHICKLSLLLLRDGKIF